MRISGFILGGICGIVAANYFAKRRPAVMQWAGSRMLDTALNRKFGKQGQQGDQFGQTSTGKTGMSGTSDQQSWQTIGKLLQTDTEAKRQIADAQSAASGKTSH